jgi:hypothetical protein
MLGCGELWKLVPIDPGNKPVILDSYAPQSVKPGEVWKILIKAEDKDGDMKDIVAKISPAGMSFLTYSITPIHEEERGEFAGYLFVKTPPSLHLQKKMFHLDIYIRDKEGRKSDSVGLLLHFTGKSEAKSELPKILDCGLMKVERIKSARISSPLGNFVTIHRTRHSGRDPESSERSI